MKRLFDDNSKYTGDADRLDREASIAIGALVKKFMEEGFCPRDIHYILSGAVVSEVCGSILRVDCDRWKARKEAAGVVHPHQPE